MSTTRSSSSSVQLNFSMLKIALTCESEISARIESRIESGDSGVVVYMFNADCHVGVVYFIMCKPTTLLHAMLYVLFIVCTVCYTTRPPSIIHPCARACL